MKGKNCIECVNYRKKYRCNFVNNYTVIIKNSHLNQLSILNKKNFIEHSCWNIILDLENECENYELIIKQNKVTKIIGISENIKKFTCNNLDSGIKYRLESFNDLPKNLEYLDCSHNKISQLDLLPCKLLKLKCTNNEILQLNNLPFNLKYLDCSNNNILQLNNLPFNLEYLNCTNNKISQLDYLPDKIIYLNCNDNQIINLDNLPYGLKYLFVNTKLSNYFSLPKNIKQLNSLIYDKFYDKQSVIKFTQKCKLYYSTKMITK